MKNWHYNAQVHSYKRQKMKEKSSYSLVLLDSLSLQLYLVVVCTHNITEMSIDQKLIETKDPEILFYLSFYKIHHI